MCFAMHAGTRLEACSKVVDTPAKWAGCAWWANVYCVPMYLHTVGKLYCSCAWRD
jgi:hypothetical protein